jgi:hypothetical protein
LGLAGGCHLFAENLLAAAAAYQRFLFLCRQLGLSLSPGKGFLPAQQGEFTGLHMCTVTGVFTVPAAKLASILECLRELLSAENEQRRAVAPAQGEIVHYSRAILYLGTVTPAIFPLTSCGSDNRRKRDAVIPLSLDFHTAVDYCIRTIVSYG